MADWIIYIRSEAICRLKPFPLQVCGLHSRILMESKKWKKIEKKSKKIRKTFTWDQERAQLMLWHIHIYYIYISFSSSEVKKIEIKKCLKVFDTSPPKIKIK